jgi:hypothetical protein
MGWTERVKRNILPVSEEKNDVRKALDEWVYEGFMYDIELPEEICELCDHPHIRYQFEIININNQNTLLIGSECISRFKISVIDQKGKKLSYDDAKKKVSKDRNKLVTEAKLKKLINSLVELASVDEEFDIENFIKYFKENGAFTPKQLATLIWRLEKHKIEFIKSHFKMSLRKNKDKQQLFDMEDWKIKTLWDCLSSSQKEIYNDQMKRKPL